MARDGFRRLFRPVSRLLQGQGGALSMTKPMAAVGERTVRSILDLAMRIGVSLTTVGASAHEASLAVSRVTDAYGLHDVHVSLTYNSLTVSYLFGEEEKPLTLMRVVRVSVPDYAKLQQLQALVVSIETGLELAEARLQARLIRRTPFLYRSSVVLLARALLASGVAVMFGASAMIVGLTFVAALAASLVQAGLAKTRVPMFFSQMAGGFAVTAVAVAVSALSQAGVGAFQGINPTIIVASGIMLMLAGLSVVGSVQDAIDGFALTATGRILDLTLQTLGVVLGILAGLEVGRAFGFSVGVPADAPSFGPLPEQLIGAMIVAVAVAVTNGAGARVIIVSGLLSSVSMLGYNAIRLFDLHVAVAAGVAALGASFIGTLIAHRFHVPSMAVTTAAILPLVPGMAVFRGLLGLVQFDEGGALLTGAGALASAAVTGIALASGASLGLSLATPLRATLGSVRRSRAGARP
ncbi:threonine/serine exporter ThrE family protein [Gulosibacter sp. 10]|uniref:threonine/serine ThrE exporter family protein n=1 Tax=Gulosibacter sp. 10 TaxID=1255570 RepID=UPI00097F6B30|nr:threonine/serine exporter family protein [Gulosibacter sp. 10]SJM71204.1 possible amino acid export carrier protein [Gulosibacter sp. 10]